MTESSASGRGLGRYEGLVIDADVHHTWPNDDVIMEYLPTARQAYRRAMRGAKRFFPGAGEFQNPYDIHRAEFFPEDGSSAGSSYELLREQLLDPFDITYAVLTHDDATFGLSGVRNPYFAAELMRAANDYTIDHWLSRDPRVLGSLILNTQVPEWAAAEVRRLGDHPQICQVLLAGASLDKPYGHPIFHPIYKAAEEMGLPISLHVGYVGGMNPEMHAGGKTSFYAEIHTLWLQFFTTNMGSFIWHGVFEEFPNLKVAFVEGGAAWVPAFLWKLDADYRSLRSEVPWVKRLPSEYFRDHMRVTTQPIEYSKKREETIAVFEMMDGKDVLMFSSDYPHWDSDEPSYVASRFPTEWHDKMFYENAAGFYRLPDGAPTRATDPSPFALQAPAGG
jgi:predicted TIM-barrel fold metal-dependent hydrolase